MNFICRRCQLCGCLFPFDWCLFGASLNLMSKWIVASDLGPVSLWKGFMLELGVPAPFIESDELAQATTKSWIFREVPGSILKLWHCFPKGVIFYRRGTPLDVFHWLFVSPFFLPWLMNVMSWTVHKLTLLWFGWLGWGSLLPSSLSTGPRHNQSTRALWSVFKSSWYSAVVSPVCVKQQDTNKPSIFLMHYIISPLAFYLA